jgi:hypothetical protein
MTFSPLALILIPTGYLFLWPLVAALNDEEEPLAVALTALALSVGALAWLMFWVGLLPASRLTGLPVLAIVVIGLAAGLAINREWFAPRRWRAYWLAQWRRLARLEMDGILICAMIFVGSVMLIHALYYPFIGDDTISRYGFQAQAIYRARRIPDTIFGYPPLAPLSFVATWFAAGQPNEHLAKVFPVVMSAGMLGATYLAGRRVLGRRAGLLAATLVAVTPMFIRYGTLGYTDIPAAFPLTLAAYYVLRWWDSGRARDAALAGTLVGVALFTKQSAFTWVAALAVVPLLWLLAARREAGVKRLRRAGIGWAGLLLPVAAIAGPWYVRNFLLGGWNSVLPIAGLYHLLENPVGWPGVVPPLIERADFGPALGILYAVGWIAGLAGAVWQGWHVVRGAAVKAPADLLLAVMVVPYWLAWWTRFSFDGRFLLLILPPMAIWTARALWWAVTMLGQYVRLPRRVWQVGGAILLAGLAIWGASDRLGGVYNAVTQPFAPDDERLLHAKGSMYDLVLYIRANFDAENDRILLMDGRMLYYLSDYNVGLGYPQKLADLEGYDYIVHSSSIYAIYSNRLGWQDSEFYRHSQDPLVFEPVYASDGVHIMRILRTDVPTREEYEAFRDAVRQQQKEIP